MRVTLRKLAREAGVSPATVSLALRNDPRVARATRRRLKELASRLGYVPDNLGRALQSSRSRLVGYLLSNATVSFTSEILQGIGEAANAAGYGVLVAITDGSAACALRHLVSFGEKNVDGVLTSVLGGGVQAELLKFEDRGVPVTVCSGASFDRRVPFVTIDDRAGGTLAARHLIELGHRRLAFCFAAGPSNERYRGACEAARAAGLNRPKLCREAGELRSLLGSPRRPTGVVCYSDFAAIDVKHEVEAAGLGVPGDVSLVGFDDMWFAQLAEFSFTSVVQPKREIGSLSMELLLERVSGGKPESRWLAPDLVVRGSTAPPQV